MLLLRSSYHIVVFIKLLQAARTASAINQWNCGNIVINYRRERGVFLREIKMKLENVKLFIEEENVVGGLMKRLCMAHKTGKNVVLHHRLAHKKGNTSLYTFTTS